MLILSKEVSSKVVILRIWRDGKRYLAECKCPCGAIFVSRRDHVESGGTSSCGCYSRKIHAELPKTHGRRYSKLYGVWKSMKGRCLNPTDAHYKDYGGRGIQVCERWLKFENFLEDMGERPEGLTLERKNNNLGYSKDNCEWATWDMQGNNRRTSRLLTYEDKTQTVSQWAKELLLSSKTIYNRLYMGWSVEKALFTVVAK